MGLLVATASLTFHSFLFNITHSNTHQIDIGSTRTVAFKTHLYSSHCDLLKKPLSLHAMILRISFTCQKEDDNNSGSGDPPKKKPTRLAIGNYSPSVTHLARKGVVNI